MLFETQRTVRFADCDPAGIVFFPQYMVMLNTVVEEWFDSGLQIPYAGVIASRRLGLPSVRLEVDFTAISRHGEVLTQRLAISRLGHSSVTLQHEFLGGEQLRMRARQVLVCTSLHSHLPQAWPEDMRASMLPYLQAAPG